MNLQGISIFKPKRRNKKSDPWLIAYGPRDKRKVVTGSVDRAETDQFAKRLARTIGRSRMGIGDEGEIREEIQRRRPLVDHLNEFERSMKAKGKTKKHATQMRLYAEECLESAETFDRIVMSLVQVRVAELSKGASSRNRRSYAVESFLKWGADDGRFPKDQVKRMKLARVAQSKTKPRRTLSIKALASLISAAERGAAISGVTGHERALIYRTMLVSGIRLGELSRARIEHLTSDGLHLPAALTKNRKEARIPLPVTLIEQIRQHTQGPLIFKIPKFNPDRLLKTDLTEAGIPRTTAEGVFDFHSLRHQCATLLASTGAPPKAIQSHMRHGSMKLTMDLYSHLMDTDRSRVREVMGKFLSAPVQHAIDGDTQQMPEIQWSDGESNPDLLNAIQKADHLLTLSDKGLRSKRGKPVSARSAQRLLRRAYVRAGRRRR